MKGVILVGALSSAILFVPIASLPEWTQRPGGTSSTSSVEKEVRSIISRRFDASYAKDVAQIGPLFADDERLTVFRDGRVFQGWKEYKAYWSSALAALPKGFRVEFRELDVRISSEQAWATARWAASSPDSDGHTLTSSGMITLILDSRPRGWHIVHEDICGDR